MEPSKEPNAKVSSAQSSGDHVPTWIQYMPGPAPTYRYNRLSPRASRAGVVACGCVCLMLSGINVALMGDLSSAPSYLTRIGLTNGSQHTQLLIGFINAIYWIWRNNRRSPHKPYIRSDWPALGSLLRWDLRHDHHSTTPPQATSPCS
ncbi:hypothetical protein BDW59DRAFT_160805 [Aspergillus cavernicola]|uniref:Uncharacterized protein n=1 Tax=Aspergillus cavernicola TaxID=176166 RepID=A0ABR4IFV7_9EURO